MGQLSRNIDLVSVMHSSGALTCEVDTADCEGVMFITVPGTTVARTSSLALKAGATTTGFVNCSSTFTHATTAANVNVVITDVYKPAKRWIGATISSSITTERFLMAFKYGLRKPVTSFSATANVPIDTGGILRAISPTSST